MGWAQRTRDRVVIGLPRGSSVHGPHFDSMLALQRDQYGREQRQLCGAVGISGLYVEDNRDMIVHRFLEEHSAPWLLMIDSDIQFAPDLLDQMLEAAHSRENIRILAGNVPLDVYPTVAFFSTPQPGVFAPLKELPAEKVFEADMAATAIMLIHREVLQAIREREGERWFLRHVLEVEERGDYPYRLFMKLGEDTSFCLRARDAGFSTWVVQGLKGVVHHNLAATMRRLAEAEAELEHLRRLVKKGAA